MQPDLCVVCDPAKLSERGCLGAPDWIIEIVSPGTARLDVATKYDLYAENGVGEYWLVFPR
ncbi:MAG: Uma2 family endonuclease [Janthinobacterium lividum]